MSPSPSNGRCIATRPHHLALRSWHSGSQSSLAGDTDEAVVRVEDDAATREGMERPRYLFLSAEVAPLFAHMPNDR